MTAFIKGNDLNQTVRRNGLSVCGCEFLCGVQAKGHIKDFPVLANAVGFINGKALDEVDFNTLSFIIERSIRFRYINILSCIHKLNRMDFLIQHHSIRSCDFLNLIFSEIQFFGFCCTVLSCRNGIHNLALVCSDRSVQSDNILGCGNLIDCTLKTADRENRLIQSLIACHGAEYLARLFYGNCTFLCHIGAYYLNNGNAAFFLGIFLHHIKINRLGI